MTTENKQKISYCLVDASDDDVARMREKFPLACIYRRDYDGNLPPIKNVIYVLRSDSDMNKYAAVKDRMDVTKEGLFDDVYGF